MRRVLGSIIALALVGVACSSGASTRTVAARAGQFRLDEWSITADRTTLPAGRQTITATNIGHHPHELVIVKASDAASLPTTPDGSVDEDQLESVTIGELADVPAGESRHTTMQLSPGDYVAFCNVVEGTGMGNGHMGGGMKHVHFTLGMHTTFAVSSGS